MTEPATLTPIEQRTAWAIHRAAAQAVRNLGGHFHCAQLIGFMATAKPGEDAHEDLGKPCARCLWIWEEAKKQQEGKAA